MLKIMGSFIVLSIEFPLHKNEIFENALGFLDSWLMLYGS